MEPALVRRGYLGCDPGDALAAVLDLQTVLASCDGVTVCSAPSDGRLQLATQFVLRFECAEAGPYEVSYQVTSLDDHHALLEGRCDDHAATHCLTVAPAVGGGSEVCWRVEVTPVAVRSGAGIEENVHLARCAMVGAGAGAAAGVSELAEVIVLEQERKGRLDVPPDWERA